MNVCKNKSTAQITGLTGDLEACKNGPSDPQEERQAGWETPPDPQAKAHSRQGEDLSPLEQTATEELCPDLGELLGAGGPSREDLCQGQKHVPLLMA